MTQVDTNLWQQATHKQMGQALERASQTYTRVTPNFAQTTDGVFADPVEAAFVDGCCFVLELAYHELAYKLRRTAKRDENAVLTSYLGRIEELKKEVAMLQPERASFVKSEEHRRTLALTIHLRLHGIDATKRYTHAGESEITLPSSDLSRAVNLATVWTGAKTDFIAEGCALLAAACDRKAVVA